MTAFIYRESSSGEGVGRCGASTAFDLDAINLPSSRRVAKLTLCARFQYELRTSNDT